MNILVHQNLTKSANIISCATNIDYQLCSTTIFNYFMSNNDVKCSLKKHFIKQTDRFMYCSDIMLLLCVCVICLNYVLSFYC